MKFQVLKNHQPIHRPYKSYSYAMSKVLEEVFKTLEKEKIVSRVEAIEKYNKIVQEYNIIDF